MKIKGSGTAPRLPFTIPDGVQVDKFSCGSDCLCERDNCESREEEEGDEAIAIVRYRDDEGDWLICDEGYFCRSCLVELDDFLASCLEDYGPDSVRVELYRRLGSVAGSYVTIWSIKEKKP